LATPQVSCSSLHSIEYHAYSQAAHYTANKASSLLPSASCSFEREKQSSQIIQTVGSIKEEGLTTMLLPSSPSA